jgi:hypothetical protein
MWQINFIQFTQGRIVKPSFDREVQVESESCFRKTCALTFEKMIDMFACILFRKQLSSQLLSSLLNMGPRQSLLLERVMKVHSESQAGRLAISFHARIRFWWRVLRLTTWSPLTDLFRTCLIFTPMELSSLRISATSILLKTSASGVSGGRTWPRGLSCPASVFSLRRV